MKILITGANGFIGQNLQLHLSERKDIQVNTFTREDKVVNLPKLLEGVDWVFHLAGVNRPKDVTEFTSGNLDLTRCLAEAVQFIATSTGKKIPIIYTSSTQATRDNPYGYSKRQAEDVLFSLSEKYDIPTYIFRLPNVFGKWCKPNYNSAIATFCYNVIRDLPIEVHNSDAPLTLAYVDDVIESFLQLLDGSKRTVDSEGFVSVSPQYNTTVGEVVRHIQSFKNSRKSLTIGAVGTGLLRALYATYVSYLPPEDFAYPVVQHRDARGIFAEMLKTTNSGQFSFFTAHPGITRGGHYHHTKTEKFLVIKGTARFKFRNMQTDETYERITTGENSEVVETVPGWTHDVTNIGSDEMIVMLWANEIFDRDRPDTYMCPLQ